MAHSHSWLLTSGPAAAAVLFSQPVSDRMSSPDRKCRYFLKLLPGDPEHTGCGFALWVEVYWSVMMVMPLRSSRVRLSALLPPRLESSPLFCPSTFDHSLCRTGKKFRTSLQPPAGCLSFKVPSRPESTRPKKKKKKSGLLIHLLLHF